MLDHQVGDPLKEAGKMQGGGDQHHRKQQDDGGEIDALEGLGRREHAKDEHRYCANHGHGSAVDFGAGQPSQREHQIAGQEDQPCDADDAQKGKQQPGSSSGGPHTQGVPAFINIICLTK